MILNIFKMIKRRIKYVLDTRIGKENLSLSDLNDGLQYISFDIFDTLIVRDVSSPSEIFRIMERKLYYPRFSEYRIYAEQEARRHSSTHEVTIYDIYQYFPNITPNEAEQYIRLELDTERQFCRSSQAMLRFFQQCQKRCPVILISDMYLPKDMMKSLLDHCGITGYHRLYISCEAGCSKRRGALYDYVLSDLGIHAKQLLHIGNDFLSDAICARRKGISVLKIRTGVVR